jgi:predicted transcriptional regulator
MRPTLLAMTALLFAAGAASAADALLPGEPAPTQDLPVDEGSSGPDWGSGLVWGLGLGGVGLVALAGVAWFLGVGGLRHIDESNVLEHPMRRSLLDQVEDSPGVHLRELANRHGTAVTNTQWHLRKLEMAGLIKTEKVQGRRLYYPTRGGVAVKEQAIKNAAVQNPNAQRILEHLLAYPGCNQRSVADALDMNPGTVRWHLRKMESAALVRSIQDGAQMCYFLVDAAPRDTRPSRPRREAALIEARP